MSKTQSAKKALRKSVRRRSINISRKGEIKGVVKAFEKSLTLKDKSAATEALRAAYKKFDKLAKVGFIKKNKAARLKSRLSKKLAKLS